MLVKLAQLAADLAQVREVDPPCWRCAASSATPDPQDADLYVVKLRVPKREVGG